MKGDRFSVSPEQVAAAQDRRQREAARKNEPKVYTVRRCEKGVITVDGKDGDWPGERLNGFALAWDAERLYVLFRGRDDRATFENKGANLVELFKSGDVVDVMLQTRPGLAAGRCFEDAGSHGAISHSS